MFSVPSNKIIDCSGAELSRTTILLSVRFCNVNESIHILKFSAPIKICINEKPVHIIYTSNNFYKGTFAASRDSIQEISSSIRYPSLFIQCPIIEKPI